MRLIFAPLAKLAQQINQPRAGRQPAQALADLAPQGVFPAGGAAPVPYAASSGAGGYGGGAVEGNVQSWYDFARKPVDQGGLGLTHEQAAGTVGNLQAESGGNIPSWGPTGDQGSAHGAYPQWQLDPAR